MDMYKLLFCLACVLTIFTFGVQAQRRFSANVFVQVVSSPDTPPNDMSKFVGAELASIVDVNLKDKGDYGLIVFIEKIPTQGPAYYAVTHVFVKMAECTYRQAIVDGKIQRPTCQALSQYSSIAFISDTQLKAKAREMVNGFQSVIIEPARKAFLLTNPGIN
jgi:hypothetical protein